MGVFMNRYKLISYLFVLLGVIVIAGSAYVIISYASDIINAIVNFVTTNDYSKLQQCGVTPPPQFGKLKDEFVSLILPSLYIGFPALLAVISALMFFAGVYYCRGKLEDDSYKREQLEREMAQKIAKRMKTEKIVAPAGEGENPAEEPELEAEEFSGPQPAAKKKK